MLSTHFVVKRLRQRSGEYRKPRNVLLHTAPGVPSRGHAVLVSLYVAINLILTFTNINNPDIQLTAIIGGRAAW